MKRFYTDVSIDASEEGFQILLDGRPIRTPAQHLVTLPTRALAEFVASEWRAQGKDIVPSSMPAMQLAVSAIDQIIGAPAEHGGSRPGLAQWKADLLRYVTTDLVCFRADGPDSLVAAQSQAWDPLIAHVRSTHGFRYVPQTEIIAAAPSDELMQAVARHLEGFDAFALAGVHAATGVTGSLIIALTLWDRPDDTDGLWAVATVDERFQTAQWGEDAEAAAALNAKAQFFSAIGSYFTGLQAS